VNIYSETTVYLQLPFLWKIACKIAFWLSAIQTCRRSCRTIAANSFLTAS